MACACNGTGEVEVDRGRSGVKVACACVARRLLALEATPAPATLVVEERQPPAAGRRWTRPTRPPGERAAYYEGARAALRMVKARGDRMTAELAADEVSVLVEAAQAMGAEAP